jgi:hypothetical protein
VKVILGCSNKDAMLIGTKVDAIKCVSMSVRGENLAKDLCCGQAFSTKYVDGHCAPKCTYGLHVFDKIKDKEERDLMKAMIADALDHMQECEDYIETVELKNLLPFNDPH